MRMLNGTRKRFHLLTTFLVACGASCPGLVIAQEDNTETAEVKKTFEPVFRVSKLIEEGTPPTKLDGNATKEETPPTNPPVERVAAKELPGVNPAAKPAPHPLDRAISIAADSLTSMRTDIVDYTAVLRKRERVKGTVGKPSYISLKVRCPRVGEQGVESPFSIYMKFLKPNDTAGREVIWVDGVNDNKLMVHEARGLIGMKTFHLEPTSMLAMQGQRYPIYDVGVENLLIKLIEKAERNKSTTGPCQVDYRDGIKINGRPCSMIELLHEDRHPSCEFHRARVFIDDELQLPCGYSAYDWPVQPGEKPQLIEEYNYFKIETNVGLTDQDFNPANPAYKFPGH
jgi:hypothetical protein